MTIRNINIQEEQLREICKRYLIRELAVFGSALREDFNEKSDVDLLIGIGNHFIQYCGSERRI